MENSVKKTQQTNNKTSPQTKQNLYEYWRWSRCDAVDPNAWSIYIHAI